MAFEPTHAAPSAGLRAWVVPDPSQEPVADLDPGLELTVVERRGQWAHVEASNGWRGWVDGDLLVELAAPPTEPQTQAQTEPLSAPQAQTEPLAATQTQPQPQPQPQTQPTATGVPTPSLPAPQPPTGEALRWGVGAALMLIFATLLDWDRPLDLDFAGQNFSGWDFPLMFLFDFDVDSTKGVSIGLALVALGSVALAYARSDQATLVWRVTGGVTLGVSALFVIQAQRLVSDFDEGWFLDILGPGFYLAMVAGVGLVMAPTRPQASKEPETSASGS